MKMGVYYYFYNQRTGEKNMQNIPEFGLSWVAKLHYMDNIEEIFRSVIAINPTWLATDIINACPDYDYEPTITYDNGIIIYNEVALEDAEDDEEDYYPD